MTEDICLPIKNPKISHLNNMVSDDKVLKALHKVVNEELNSDMSQERLADIYEVVKLMISITDGTFVCSKCKGSYKIYEIRGK